MITPKIYKHVRQSLIGVGGVTNVEEERPKDGG
jgi:hypothetical protein